MNGATGKIEFDEKGDRKNAEITIFTLKEGKVVPIGVVQAGKSYTFADFMGDVGPGACRCSCCSCTRAPAPATPPAPAPAAPKK